MALPFSRNRTYADGVTQVPAGDMNDMQDLLVRMWKSIAGSGFHIYDDFVTSTLNTTLWDAGTATSVDDSASGAFGAMTIDDGVTVATKSVSGHIGSSADFYYAFRVRLSTDGNQTFSMGLESSTAGQSVYLLRTGTAGANWQVRIDSVDTSLGVAPGSTYQLLEVVRLSGVIYVYVNGVLKHSVAHITSITNLRFFMTKNTTVVLVVDMAKLWFDR